MASSSAPDDAASGISAHAPRDGRDHEHRRMELDAAHEVRAHTMTGQEPVEPAEEPGEDPPLSAPPRLALRPLGEERLRAHGVGAERVGVDRVLTQRVRLRLLPFLSDGLAYALHLRRVDVPEQVQDRHRRAEHDVVHVARQRVLSVRQPPGAQDDPDPIPPT
ncbi:hypothetical protein GCM10020001_058340 [Nonomuraea salmonea]